MFSIILLIVCLVFGYIMVCRLLPRVNEQVPTYPGKLPIIGHFHMFLKSETLARNFISFGEHSLKAGGVAKVFIGPVPAYVVTDPVDVNRVLNKCLKRMFLYKFIKPILGKMVTAAEIPVWRRNRPILGLCFKQHILDEYLEVFNDQAGRLVELVAEYAGKGEVDLTEKITCSVLETACQTTFGARLDGKDLVDNNLIVAINEILDIMVARFTKPWLIFDFIFNLSSYKKKLSKTLAVTTELADQMVALRKTERLHRLKMKEDVGYAGRKFQSFLDVLIENTVTETSSFFTDVELRNIAESILFGAHDTSVYEILYAFICIGSHPEVQEKIYQEVTEVLGEDGRVTKQNISQLVYLEAAIKEAIRLYPVGMLVGREATEDTKLRNVTIPAGSSVLVHIWSVNRNTEYWGPDAEEFKPERWLSSDTVPSHYGAFASFSPGLRGCVGKAYALMYMKATMAPVLRKYKLTADRTQMKLAFKIVLKPVAGHLLKIEERR